MPVRLVEAKFYGRRSRRGSHVFSARSSFFTIRDFSPSDSCSRPLILARRMRFSAARYPLRKGNS